MEQIVKEQTAHFTCGMVSNNRKQDWTGKIRLINMYDPCEAIVEAEGLSYHMIIGHYQNGYYLCIPGWKIGMDIAHPADSFWNTESMLHAGLSKKKTTIFVQALITIAEIMEKEMGERAWKKNS